MQAYQISTKCGKCDILLDGREQFIGHMIHSHDMAFEQVEAAWRSIVTERSITGQALP